MANNEECENWKKEIDALAADNKSDKLELFNKTKAGFDKFNGAEDGEILWRMARDSFLVACAAERKKDKATQKTYVLQAEEWGNKAVEKNPDSVDARRWLAMILGKVSDFVATKERIEKGKEIQKHLEAAIKIRPEDAYLYHVYGRWCFEVAKLSWMERSIAKLVFGTPPEATYQDAVDKFLKAEKLKPNWKTNSFYLAKSYIEVKMYKEAIDCLDKGVAYESETDEDHIVSEEMVALQTKYAKYR